MGEVCVCVVCGFLSVVIEFHVLNR